MDLDSLLSREQKESILGQRLRAYGLMDGYSIRYDRRYSWDFEARRVGNHTVVTFSVSLNDHRFPHAVIEMARAVWSLKTSNASAVRKSVSGSIMLPERTVWYPSLVSPCTALALRQERGQVACVMTR